MSVKMCKVKNRSTSECIYSIPEENIRRSFRPGETKNLEYDELAKLAFQPGGRALMENFLQIENADVTSDLNINREVEYNMSEKDIIEMLDKGSLDQLLDALDFAPIGVIDLIKQFAVQLPLNDMEKRKAILDKTGFDVSKAVAHVEEEKMDDISSKQAAPQRRVQQTESTTPQRRIVKKDTSASE